MAEQEQEETFETALQKLEEIVAKLENGDVPLEKAITYYQEGMKLSKKCNDKLNDVQEQMTSIMDENGETKPFELQEET